MIPDIRGPFHSRPMHDIIAEARDLAGAGVKELILVPQDTTLYGADFRTGVHHQDTKSEAPGTSEFCFVSFVSSWLNFRVRFCTGSVAAGRTARRTWAD